MNSNDETIVVNGVFTISIQGFMEGAVESSQHASRMIFLHKASSGEA